MAAGELVALGHCSPACLLAIEADGKCRCRCGGRYHGRLADLPVEQFDDLEQQPARSNEPWFSRYCHYSQFHLDQTCPVVRTTSQFNKVWRTRTAQRSLFVVAQGRSRFSWTATTDAFTARSDYREDMLEVGRQLVEITLVAKSNRDAIGEVGSERLSVGGLRSPHDAQVLASAFSELWWHNPDGALRLIAALREDLEREARSRPASAAWLAANP